MGEIGKEQPASARVGNREEYMRGTRGIGALQAVC